MCIVDYNFVFSRKTNYLNIKGARVGIIQFLRQWEYQYYTILVYEYSFNLAIHFNKLTNLRYLFNFYSELNKRVANRVRMYPNNILKN